MSQENDDFGIGAFSQMYQTNGQSQGPQSIEAGTAPGLLPAMPVTPTPAHASEKKSAKRKADPASSQRQTRSKSQKKGEEPSPPVEETAPSVKKSKGGKKGEKAVTETAKIFVEGTLGHGDNAAYIHPSTPPAAKKLTIQSASSAQPVQTVEQVDGLRPFHKLSMAEQWVKFREFMEAQENGAEGHGHVEPRQTGLPSPQPTPTTLKTSARRSKASVIESEDESGVSSEEENGEFDAEKRKQASAPLQDDPFSDDSSSDKDVPLRTCEVTKPGSGDALLADTIEGLPCLRACGLVGVSPGTRFYVFSEWEKLDGFLFKPAKSCMTFSRFNEFVNLARCDPGDLNVYTSGVKKPKHFLQVGNDSAICLTPICVGLSLLGNNRNDLGQHEVGGILHSHEFDRFIAVLGMAFNVESLKPTLWRNLFKFVTYGNQYGNGAYNVDSNVGSSLIQQSSSFSPKKGRIVQPLGADDPVPIFDARGLERFRLQKLVEKLAGTDPSLSITDRMKLVGLREYPENIKGGSFVVVAHTVNANEQKWENKPVLGLNCNIQWVILLAEGTHKAPL